MKFEPTRAARPSLGRPKIQIFKVLINCRVSVCLIDLTQKTANLYLFYTWSRFVLKNDSMACRSFVAPAPPTRRAASKSSEVTYAPRERPAFSQRSASVCASLEIMAVGLIIRDRGLIMRGNNQSDQIAHCTQTYKLQNAARCSKTER